MCELKCAYCGEGEDLDLDGTHVSDLEDGDRVDCLNCGETSRVWQDGLVSEGDYHEYSCDSKAAAKYEEDAYGDDREHYISGEPYRSGYRGDREDFRSDY